MWNKNSQTYILVFTLLVAGVCAVFVSLSVVLLKDKQEMAQKTDRIKHVLYASGLATKKTSSYQLLNIFEKQVEPFVIHLESFEKQEDDPLSLDPKKDSQIEKTSMPVSENKAKLQRIPKKVTVYKIKKQDGSFYSWVLPIQGKGLWSHMYAFLSLEKDANTIQGVSFYEQGETPGLGGEIENPRWNALWKGKKLIKDESLDTLITVNKNKGQNEYEIDGISGATLTSLAVGDMLQFWALTYQPLFQKLREDSL